MSRTIKNIKIFLKVTISQKIFIKDFEKTKQHKPITGKFCFRSHLHKNAGERFVTCFLLQNNHCPNGKLSQWVVLFKRMKMSQISKATDLISCVG